VKYFKPLKFSLSVMELSLLVGTPAVTGFTEVRREYGPQAEGLTAGMARIPVVRM